MVRRRRDQPVTRLRKRELDAAAQPIIASLKEWSGDKRVIAWLRDARPKMPQGLGDRAEDICEPLLAIAEMAGGDWPAKARAALVRLKAKGDTDDEDTKTQLLSSIREIFQTLKPDHISSKDLLERLIDREDEPWAAWWKKDFDNGNTKGLGAKLAKMLKPFGIVSRTIRAADGSTPKGYPLASFNEAFDCYLPPLPPSPG
jgi:putative DNA primase/helicase